MSSKTWLVGAVAAAMIAVGGYAYVQHRDATALAAQVAQEAADAARAHETAATLAAQLATVAKAAEQARNEAAAKLVAETRPDLPIDLSFRRGLVSTGLVGVFRNTSSKELEFSLDLQSPATGRHIHRSIVLNPHALLEIGALQGWPFAPGQQITMNNPAYRPLVHTVGG